MHARVHNFIWKEHVTWQSIQVQLPKTESFHFIIVYIYVSKKGETLFKYETAPSIILIHKFPLWNIVYKISACDVKQYWLRYNMELFKMSKVHSYGYSITILSVVFNILFYTDPYKFHRK